MVASRRWRAASVHCAVGADRFNSIDFGVYTETEGWQSCVDALASSVLPLAAEGPTCRTPPSQLYRPAIEPSVAIQGLVYMCRFAGVVCHSLFALSNAAQEANRAQVTALEAYQYSRCFVRLQPASLTGLYSNKTQHKPLQGQLLAHERATSKAVISRTLKTKL